MAHRAGLPRSPARLHDPGGGGRLDHLHAACSPTGTRAAPDGTELIPGWRPRCRRSRRDGKTYTLTLRKGSCYSNGQPVKASDFAYTIERAIKARLGRQAASSPTTSSARRRTTTGQAKTISGHHDRRRHRQDHDPADASRTARSRTCSRSRRRAGPGGTPMHEPEPTDPPPGVGPYMITDVVPNQSFGVVKNPKFAALNIPDIPTGHLDRINVKIESNTQTAAQQVLNNTGGRLRRRRHAAAVACCRRSSRRRATASSRSTIPSTFYFFMNTTIAAVQQRAGARRRSTPAIDRPALAAAGERVPAAGAASSCRRRHRRASDSAVPVRRRGRPRRHRQGPAARAAVRHGRPAVTVWGEQRAAADAVRATTTPTC